MKTSKARFLVSAIILSIVLCVNASARCYIGGGFSISNIGSNPDGTYSSNSFRISLSPNIGWRLNPRWVAGVRPTFDFSSTSNGSGSRSNSFYIGAQPYSRYCIFNSGRVGIWAEANARVKYCQNLASSRSKAVEYGFRILPMFTIALDSHFFLEAYVNLLSMEFAGQSIESGGSWNSSSRFNFFSTTNQIFDPLKAISIGFTYCF